MKTVLAAVSAILAVIFSPLGLRHKCGLTSWPLEWLVCFAVVGFSVYCVFKSKKPWLAWCMLLLAPLGSLVANILLALLLHWSACPNFIFDESGKAFRLMHGSLN